MNYRTSPEKVVFCGNAALPRTTLPYQLLGVLILMSIVFACRSGLRQNHHQQQTDSFRFEVYFLIKGLFQKDERNRRARLKGRDKVAFRVLSGVG